MIQPDDLYNIDMGFTLAVRALITAMGMQAENQKRLSDGLSIAYGEDQFNNIITDNDLYYNVVVERWRSR